MDVDVKTIYNAYVTYPNCLSITFEFSIYSFSDSVRRRCSVLQWHPDFATQLIVASDDDSSPSLRVIS